MIKRYKDNQKFNFKTEINMKVYSLYYLYLNRKSKQKYIYKIFTSLYQN